MTENPTTFWFQNKLPHLPVPDLQETCLRYLRSLRPVLTNDEYVRTRNAVDVFRRQGGVGEKLQSALLERAEELPNWLIDWWDDFAYFLPREPIVIYHNYSALVKPYNHLNDQVRQAALFVTGLLKFKKLLDTETLEPQYSRDRTPLCMARFKNIFSACRIPGEMRDSLAVYRPDESKHLLVIRANQFFWFEVYDKNNQPLSTSELAKQLERIIELSELSSTSNSPVAVLTAEDRTTWAKQRNKIITIDSDNAEAMAIIERSLFVLCLDDGVPGDMEAYARAALHGEGGDRWFDKSFHLIVSKNGDVAYHCEHSVADASVMMFMFDHVAELARTADVSFVRTVGCLPPINKIRWHMNDEIELAIEEAQRNFDYLVANEDMKLIFFPQFGKDFIKENKLSPDGFCQIAMHLAYYKLHGKGALTYEAAQTRRFLYGRTENLRSCSMQAMTFVKAMERPECLVEQKYSLLREAIKWHRHLASQAANGQGVDRHLLGLRLLASEAGIETPAIFSDPAYQRDWLLATSQIEIENGLGLGFGSIAEDEYGVAYCIKPDNLFFHIVGKRSCQATSSARFAQALEQSLMEMKEICLSEQRDR